LFEDFKSWEETLNQEAEHFTGETLLSREDELYQMNRQVDGWTDVALKVNKNNDNKSSNNSVDDIRDIFGQLILSFVSLVLLVFLNPQI